MSKADPLIMSGRYSALGYRSASRLSQVDGISITGGWSGDAHADLSREKMVAISRDLMRDNPIYRGIIGRCVSYVVGKGFALQARSVDAAWNAKAEALWNEFWQYPEVRGTMSGKRVESMVFQEMLATGDAFAAFVTRPGNTEFNLQLFESEQCTPDKPSIDNGVITDEYGAPLKYNLVGYGRGGMVKKGTKNFIDAANVIHVFDHERPSASRGVPALQSTFGMLHRINDTCDAEAIARQMLAHLALSVTRAEGQARAYEESEADPADSEFRIQELDYATIFHCAPGESIAGINRNIPGADFEPSMLLFLRVLGLPLGLPLEIVLLDWTKSNYSQSRAVLQQAFENFCYWQNLLKSKSMSRIYRRKLAEWIKAGKLEPVDRMEAHEWVAPSFPWLDELKEIQAQERKISLGMMSHAEGCKLMQRDREEVVRARVEEITDAINKAKEVEKATGVLPPWQILCGLPLESYLAIRATAEQEKLKQEAIKTEQSTDDSAKQ